MERTLLGGTFRNAAKHMRDEAVAAEQRSTNLSEVRAQSELCASGYLLVVAFMESVVNDAFLDAQRGSLCGADQQAQAKMAAYWRSKMDDFEEDEKGVGIIRRYNRALKFSQVETFKAGDPIHDDARTLIRIRNALTHFVSAWQDPDDPEGMSKELQEKGWRHRNPLRPPPGPPESESPLFPYHVLCSDGITWAIDVADAFTTEWTNRLGLRTVWWRID